MKLSLVSLCSLVASNGYVTSPPSRIFIGHEKGLHQWYGSAIYDVQGMEGSSGFPQNGPTDGHIASVDCRWSCGLDVEGRDFDRTEVMSNESVSVRWHFTQTRPTSSFEYYITTSDWKNTEPLSRNKLEYVNRINYDGQESNGSDVHSVTMPHRVGKHVLLAVWNLHDTPKAYYQVIDIVFSDDADQDLSSESDSQLHVPGMEWCCVDDRWAAVVGMAEWCGANYCAQPNCYECH